MTTNNISNHTEQPQQINSSDIHIPLQWLTASGIGFLTLFFSVTWWIKGLKSTIDSQSTELEEIESFAKTQPERCAAHKIQMEKATENQVEKLNLDIKKDIAQSSSNICHSFELFAVEIRQRLNGIEEKMLFKDEKIEELKKKYSHLNKEFYFFIEQLQRNKIDVHRREYEEDR